MTTNVIRGGRGSGKTITMIQLSCEKQIPILVANQFAADALMTTAKRLGYNNLPKPFTVHDVQSRNALIGRRDILVDDADQVFSKLLNGINIHAATYTPSFYEYELEDGPMNTFWLKSNPMLKWLTGDFEKGE